MKPARTWVVCLLLVAVANGRAQDASRRPPKCPGKMSRSMEARALCARALPLARAILLAEADGTVCTCACDSLAAIPDTDLHAAKRARSVHYAANAQRYFRSLPRSNEADGSKNERWRIRFTAGKGPVEEGTLPCDVDRACANLVRSFYRMDSIAFRDFVFVIEERVTDDAFPYIAADPETVGYALYGTVRMPRRFLDDAAVKHELRSFMLLHEIGHAVEYTGSEYEADDWAARVGFPDQYGFWWPHIGRSVLHRVAEQLAAFHRSQFVLEDADLPLSCFEDQTRNCYPRLACRQLGILGAFSVHLPLEQYDRGYPVYAMRCWSEGIDQRRFEPGPNAEHPCEARCDEPPLLCDLFFGWCELEALIQDLPHHVDAATIKAPLGIPLNEKRRIERRIDRLLREVGDLKNDLDH